MEWKTIESAPKDGEYVMFWVKWGDTPLIARWLELRTGGGGFWSGCHDHVDAEGGWEGAVVVDNFSKEELTHWMPLPKEPS